jgi:hypothetical protein
LKDFLSKPEGEVIEVPKKVEEVEPERTPVVDQICKICGEVGAKMKSWYLTTDSVNFARTLSVSTMCERNVNLKTQTNSCGSAMSARTSTCSISTERRRARRRRHW